MNRPRGKMKKEFVLFIFCVVTLSVALITFLVFKSEKPMVLNIALILYNDDVTRSDQIISWINSTSPTFVKWNFICEVNITTNTTLINFLRQRGEVLAQTFYPQLYSPGDREKSIDFLKTTFDSIGAPTSGIFMFQPDTYTLNYAKTKGFTHCVGYCFDQYRIDHMTMKGGWQLPYYHNENNSLRPSEKNDGLVVYPHLTWDWAASLTVSHQCCTHILGVRYDLFPQDDERSARYIFDLVKANLNSVEPFGYATYMFEWNWAVNQLNLSDYSRVVTAEIIKEFGSYAKTYKETTEWFRRAYPTETPTYHFTFTSPYDGSTAEWYFNKVCRIARIEGQVRSYVLYVNQTDRFLEQPSTINWSNPNSAVDNSLSFVIDDLGGGRYRDIPHGGSRFFDGDLEDFPTIDQSQSPLWKALPAISIVASGMATSVLRWKQRGQRAMRVIRHNFLKNSSRVRRYLTKKPYVFLVIVFQVLILMSGTFLVQGNPELANNLAIWGFCFLIVGVLLRAISLAKHEEDGTD